MFDKVIATIAPFSCVLCNQKGYSLCPACELTGLEQLPSRCYRCHRATSQSQVCSVCRKAVTLNHVWVVSAYQGMVKDIIDLLKFQRASAVSVDIARCMSSILPLLPKDTIVCHVPTAHKRIRERGYDQARLIAKSLAKQKGLSYQKLCSRLSASRQLGASRDQRFMQAKKAFALHRGVRLEGAFVLIVDDVTTSGATLEAIARLFKDAGAKQIDAVVFAQAID